MTYLVRLFTVSVLLLLTHHASAAFEGIVQHPQVIKDFDISADGRYVVTVDADGTTVALWSLEKRRMIKKILYPNGGVVRSHPSDPRIVYIKQGNGGVALQEDPLIGINIFTGEKCGYIDGRIIPSRNSFHPDFSLKLTNGRIDVKTRRSRQLVGHIGGRERDWTFEDMTISSDDSLVAVHGNTPLIWDLKRASVARTRQDQALLNPSHENPMVLEGYKINFTLPLPCGDMLTADDAGDICRWQSGVNSPTTLFSVKNNLWGFATATPMHHLSLDSRGAKVIASGEAASLFEIDLENPGNSFQYDTSLSGLSTFTCSEYLSNDRFVTCDGSGRVSFWKSGLPLPEKSFVTHGAHPRKVQLLQDGTRLVSSDIDGSIVVWDVTSQSPIVSAYSFDGGDTYAWMTPDFYYKTTPGALSNIHFVEGLEVFPIEQFDLRFNRPDIVLSRLGCDEKITEPYHKAWLKRLRRMGVDEKNLQEGSLLAPEVTITNLEEIPSLSRSRSISISFKVSTSNGIISKIFVNINGVPILGKLGKELSQRGLLNYEEDMEIELCEGENSIEIFALGSNGAESYRKTIDVLCEPPIPAHRRLFVAAVGVSDYRDKLFNLRYAAKDATDVTDLFNNAPGYDETKTLLLRDIDFSPSSLTIIKDFFSEASRDDAVVLFYAGHGLLDNDLNYFLSHYEIDFYNPAFNGIPYEDFENVLDGVKAIRRLCLIDACHSGEIDKDDYLAENVVKVGLNQLTFRSPGTGIRKMVHGAEAANTLFNQLFVDIRWGIGATVISSAGGMEAAIEGDDWNNGIFTFYLKKAFSSETADYNGDSRLSATEIGRYLCSEVAAATGGLQTPSMRSQNNKTQLFFSTSH